jgi:hypothetical protein
MLGPAWLVAPLLLALEQFLKGAAACGRVRAADLLRSIRDQALLLDGLHLIVVGTTDAVRTVVQSHTQIRSVFSDPQVLPKADVA